MSPRRPQVEEQFLAIVSHELRTPLNAVTGFGSILADEIVGPLNPRQQELLGKLLTAADGLCTLVDDLLDATLIQAGRLVLTPAPAEAAAIAAEVEARLAPAALAKGLALSLHVAEGLPPFPCDALRVGQALHKLAGNAVKFTPDGGQVAIRVYGSDPAPAEVVFEVEDSGPGIAETDLARLFRRFGQLDMSATRRAGGAGLGLHLAQALVEAHGGTIGVRSEPGRGSTFWFALPSRPSARPLKVRGRGRAGTGRAG